MPVPGFGAAGVIPPFLNRPEESSNRSPYEATALEVVNTLATSTARCAILRGWLAYRKKLAQLGATGFQWVAGSFCEDVSFRTPPQPEPKDIDVVTFIEAPDDNAPIVQAVMMARDLRGPEAKRTYSCDAYIGRVSMIGAAEIPFVTYWYGLFSHRRVDFQWKGMLKVPLTDHDDEATEALRAAEDALAAAAAMAASQAPVPSPGGQSP